MKDVISFDTFSSVDLRVGRVTAIENVLNSEKLYKMTVDFGSVEGTRTIYAGLKKWYSKRKFLNKVFVFVLNLAPRPMPGGESQGMILAIDNADKPLLLAVPKDAVPGSGLR